MRACIGYAITRVGDLLPARFGRDLLPAAVDELMCVSGIAKSVGETGDLTTSTPSLASWCERGRLLLLPR